MAQNYYNQSVRAMKRALMTNIPYTTVTDNTSHHQWPEPMRVQVGGAEWRVDHADFNIDPMGNRSVRLVVVPPHPDSFDVDQLSGAVMGGLPPEPDEPEWAKGLARALGVIAERLEELTVRVDDLAHNLEGA